MTKKNIHIVPSGKKWAVKPEGSKPVSTHLTQSTAAELGKKMAKDIEAADAERLKD